MYQFLRGVMGPLTGDDEFCGDGFAGSVSLLVPLALACFSGGGGPGEDDLDPLPEPLVTGNADVDAAMRRYHNDVNRTHTRNNTRQATYRRRMTEAEEKAKLAPPEGAVVLTGDDAKAWEVFKTLGPVAEVQTKLGERDTLAARVAESDKSARLDAIAQAAGVNAKVLKRVGGDREYELRDATVEGKAVKQAFVKDGDVFKPLGEYIDTEWSDLKPALLASGGTGGTGTGGGGIPYPAQPPAAGTGPTNPIDAAIKAQNDAAAAQPSAFAPIGVAPR